MANIEYRKGNLLSDDSQALVNAVNCVGICGSGIAKQFREAYPNNYEEYRKHCFAGFMEIGWCLVTKQSYWLDREKEWDTRYIINFPTKYHWKNDSKLEWIRGGLWDLKRQIGDYGIKSIAMPLLGCGLGKLDKEKVKPLIERELSKLENVYITVYDNG